MIGLLVNAIAGPIIAKKRKKQQEEAATQEQIKNYNQEAENQRRITRQHRQSVENKTNAVYTISAQNRGRGDVEVHKSTTDRNSDRLSNIEF